MIRLIIGILLTLILVSCGTPLREDGTFGKEEFVGRFRDVSIYRVEAPNGTALYIGTSDGKKIVSTQYSTGGKSPLTVRTIIEDSER